MAGSERAMELAPGRRNIMEKAHDIKYQGVVMHGAFSMGGDGGFKRQMLGFILQGLGH